MSRVIADKYEVRGVLGEGGTGVVYDTVTKDGAAVALKVMHAALAGDKQVRGRFRREAEILRRLEGKHVCPILDFGEVPSEEDPATSLLYIALPKIEGTSLADLLGKGWIEVDRGLDIMLEILAALATAHDQGIIHRDLKPANVLLKDGVQVIVVDFGMSKIVTGGGMGTTNLTTHNMVFGTPEYMSPEQARGDELDARCDVYAAGVILYEILTGAPPFTGETPLSVLTAHLTSDLEPPSKRPGAGDRVSPALESVVVHSLSRDRDRRYASASAFAAAIRQAKLAPNNVLSLRPAASTAAAEPREALAATLPATLISAPHEIDVTAPTLLGNQPSGTSAAPPSRPFSKAPSSLPSRPPPEPEATRSWILAWVLVGIASIAIGVYFALK